MTSTWGFLCACVPIWVSSSVPERFQYISRILLLVPSIPILLCKSVNAACQSSILDSELTEQKMMLTQQDKLHLFCGLSQHKRHSPSPLSDPVAAAPPYLCCHIPCLLATLCDTRAYKWTKGLRYPTLNWDFASLGIMQSFFLSLMERNSISKKPSTMLGLTRLHR